MSADIPVVDSQGQPIGSMRLREDVATVMHEQLTHGNDYTVSVVSDGERITAIEFVAVPAPELRATPADCTRCNSPRSVIANGSGEARCVNCGQGPAGAQ